MDWSPKDIQEFFWSLGPAAVGLFLIWFAQVKVTPNRATDDQRMRLAVVGAYAGCWVTGIAALFTFVWIWIGPYVSNGRYIRGELEDVPNNMSVSTVDTETADIFFMSERTSMRAPVRTFAFVVRDNAGRRILRLSFSSDTDAFVAGVDLSKIGSSALMNDVRLAFQQDKLPNGEARYLLAHTDSKSEFLLKRRDRNASLNEKEPDTQLASSRAGGNWFQGLLAAYAQSAPSMSWTRESLVSGLESPSLKTRNVAVSELAEKLFVSPEYANIAEAIVTRKEEGATIRGRWSVYDATKAAIEAARIATPAQTGILSPPLPAALPLSKEALGRAFVDALSGTATANDAAKWLFRHSYDPRTIELLFNEIEAENNPDTKACYAAFAANVFYNWAVDAFLAAKAEGRPWFISDRDIKLIENLYVRVSALSPVAKASDESASQFVIATYGLGLFYAELSLLPADRLKGAALQSAAEHERWTTRSKALMTEASTRVASGSKTLELYRYPFHRDIASAIASSGVSAAALKPSTPQIVNPQIRDNVCRVSLRT
jgi:hypothetical protein